MDTAFEQLPALKDAMAEHDVAITSVAIYGGAIEAPAEDAIAYYARAVSLAKALGCGVVSGLTGRDNTKTVIENLPLFRERFGPIAEHAADHGVRIALEPWPGSVLGHGPYRWTNLATTPELWDMLFDAVPSPSLGIEFDPSHLAWQEIDYVQAILDYGARIPRTSSSIASSLPRLAFMAEAGGDSCSPAWASSRGSVSLRLSSR